MKYLKTILFLLISSVHHNNISTANECNPVLKIFTAEWCISCKRLKMEMEESNLFSKEMNTIKLNDIVFKIEYVDMTNIDPEIAASKYFKMTEALPEEQVIINDKLILADYWSNIDGIQSLVKKAITKHKKMEQKSVCF